MSLRAAASLLILALGSCALPLNLQEPGSPSLVGIVKRGDGMPGVAVRVAITNDYSSPSCGHTNARAFSDSSGIFRFAPTTYVQHWMLFFPAFERFSNYYAVCTGVADSTLARAYEGSVSLHYREAPARDTLRCLEWEWQDRPRVTCNGPGAEDRIQAAGTWSDADGAGFHRLIVVRDEFDDARVGVYVQWVQRTDAGPPLLVRQTIALPLPARLLGLGDVRMYAVSTAPCVELHGTLRAAHWYSWGPTDVHDAWVLGAPGQMRAVTACP